MLSKHPAATLQACSWTEHRYLNTNRRAKTYSPPRFNWPFRLDATVSARRGEPTHKVAAPVGFKFPRNRAKISAGLGEESHANTTFLALRRVPASTSSKVVIASDRTQTFSEF